MANINIKDDLRDALKLLSAKTKVPMQKYVNEFIEKGLKNEKA